MNDIRNDGRERAEFEAIKTSGLFHPGSNSAKLLSYVCGRYFDGARTITEAEIAIGALERQQNFDSKADAIVRVEAHRVRKRLAEYYESAGADHTLRLVLPPGSYAPRFEPAPSPAADAAKPESTRKWPPSRRTFLLTASAVTVPAVVAPVVWWRGSRHEAGPAHAKLAGAAGAAPQKGIRIAAGSPANGYTDRLGHTWSSDQFFEGGAGESVRYRRIARTEDPQLFLSVRQGYDFSYHIPLSPGLYELRLYFAETFYGDDNTEGGGESSRIFDVFLNGAPLLSSFDPLSDAGGSNTADARVFAGVSPAADGKLHLRFHARYALKSVAILNAIEMIPTRQKVMDPILWITADAARVDSQHRLWQPDQFVLGGRRREHRESLVTKVANPELYQAERYGHFSYAIPVADGVYTLTLHFSEHWFGVEGYAGGNAVGTRIFDVFCNGVALLRDFDIVKEAEGPLKPLTRTFRGLKPNHQGKLLLSFVPTTDYACLNALEVVEESHRTP